MRLELLNTDRAAEAKDRDDLGPDDLALILEDDATVPADIQRRLEHVLPMVPKDFRSKSGNDPPPAPRSGELEYRGKSSTFWTRDSSLFENSYDVT